MSDDVEAGGPGTHPGYEPFSPAEKLRIIRMALDLQTALLCYPRAPRQTTMWERSQKPQAGDWVIETSTASGLLSEHWRSRVGEERIRSMMDGQVTRFLRTEQRMWYDGVSDHEPGDPPEPPQYETAWVCENPDGSEYAWTNAAFMVVPLEQSLDPRY